MENKTQFLQTGTGNIQILTLLIFLLGFVFNGCAALQEAQKQRQKRLDERRKVDQLLLAASDANIVVDPTPIEGKPHGESDHYTLTFADDLLVKADFDEEDERKMFANSALSYMESLYNALHSIFGFKPKHKIHVTLYDLYQGTDRIATTGTQYGFRNNGRFVAGIEMNFPMNMYDRHEVRVHELTHAFTNIYYLPTWFSEGIAVLMQTEYAKGGGSPKYDNLKQSMKLDPNGINELENWGSHRESTSLTPWRYSYAYTVVSELREKYGKELYIRLFELMDADQLHLRLYGKMPSSFLIYYMSQAAGKDLVPFFKELQFKVQKLEKDDLVKYIQQINAESQKGHQH